MIKKLRIKMTATVMLFVTVLIAALVCVIIIIPQQRSSSDARSYMSRMVGGPDDIRMGKNDGPPFPDGIDTEDVETPGDMPEDMPEDMQKREKKQNELFSKANFVTVKVNADGEIASLRDDNELYEEEYIKEAVGVILKKNKDFGIYDGNYYYVEKGDITTVILMDNSLSFENSRKTAVITLISAFCVWWLFLALMIFAVRKMTEPVKTAIDKQRRFISDAGHELKTPVAVIKANTEVQRSETGESKWLTNINTESDRMNKLIGNLMMLAEIDDPTENSPHIRFDLSQTVEGTALPFESLAFEKGILLTTDIEQDIFINGNASRIEELVSIFINNAVKYGEKEIKVSLHREHKTAKLTVYNKGIGIKPEERDRIFERFYRIDKDRSRKSGNYGLGLAIARSIIEEHGARVSVEGEYGSDVSFCVTFRCAE